MNVNLPVKSFLTIGIALIASINAIAQELGYSEEFQEAMRLDEENEHSQALTVWTRLAREYPDNPNVNYRAGRAYLSSFNRKSAALPFLKKSIVQGIDKNYDPISPQQEKPPVEAYYYLAQAYHLNYDFDKAEEYYNEFMNNAPAKHFLYPEAVLGIRQTANARELTSQPLDFKIENLGPVVNSPYPDYSPVISADENSLFYTSRRLRADSSNINFIDRSTGGYFEDIYVSYKDRTGHWQTPELLSLNNNGHTATMNVSPDGQTLYIYRDDNGDGNIYESKLVGETWTPPVKMAPSINSSHWETHIAVTADEQTAYFVSDRPGGLGGRDIWRVKKLPNGEWSQALNVGPVLNTEYEEDAVFISPDQNTLYFSSQGHTSMGGFDIFRSTMDDEGNWTEPRNLGYPINTVDDDVFFVTSADGKRGYYSSVRDEGYGEKDIYMIELPEPPEVRLALLKGVIIPVAGHELPDNMVVYVTNDETGERTAYVPRARDGVFVAILPPCYNYSIAYVIDGETAGSDSFQVDCDSTYQEIQKELLLNPALVDADGRVVVMTSTEGTGKPADFKRQFGYNENTVEIEEQLFSAFIANVKNIVDTKGEAHIRITGSASKVPTRTYKTNQNLADIRAEEAKERILLYTKALGVDADKLIFDTVEGKVQGPAYRGDYKTGKDKYRAYQYVEIHAE